MGASEAAWHPLGGIRGRFFSSEAELELEGENPDRVRLQSSGVPACCSGFGFRHKEEAGPSMGGDVNRGTQWYVLKASAHHMKMAWAPH